MPRIPDVELDRLKAEVSLVRLIEGAGYALKSQGKDLAMRCPFHEGDDTPSFIVTPAKNVWHCFGCQAGGSVVDWVMRRDGVSFRHAVELLREGAFAAAGATPVKAAPGILPPAPFTRPCVAQSTVPRLPSPVAFDADDAALLVQVIDYYHTTLKQEPDALAYLHARGLDHPDLIDHFCLGFANRTLGLRLPEKNRLAGADVRTRLQRIGVYRENGREHFNGSLVIPVTDASGTIAEAYGRKITPAHRLRPGTALHLYLPGPHRGVFNLDGWRGSVEVILCEALIDALTFWCAGYRNVTSAFGVSGFTDELLGAFVAHGVQRVLIAYDADEAGHSAAAKLAPLLESKGIAPFRVLFPKGMDANSYAQKVGPPAKSLRLVIEQAQSLGSGVAPVRGATVPVCAAIDASDPLPVTETLASPVPDDLPLAAASAVPPDDVALSAALTPTLPSSPALDVREDEAIAVFGERRYRVRGLKKNLSFDTLKVNVQASTADHLFIDTLDLYQAKARAAFVKAAAIELGVAEAVIGRDLVALLRALEPVQEAAITRTLKPAPELPALSADDEAAALALLRDPRLMDRIAADVDAIGVVGEGSNALVGYLACVSRKLDKPLAILIQSTSAAGKSTLMDALLSLMPEAERVHYSAMTGQSLFYLGEQAMKHKILAIAEEEGVRQAAYALKLLQSQGELTIASTGKDPATGQLVTQEYRVEGPVMLFLTTTAIEIDEELLNRCLVLTINETREQTEAIHQKQRSARTLAGLLATQHSEAVRTLHRAAQTLLRPLAVVNPYAEQLTFRSESTRLRRDHAKYLTLIDSIALLHQHQRPLRTVEHGGALIEYVEVTLDDLALANRLAHEVLGRSLDELPPQTRRVLGVLDGLVRERMQAHAIARSDVRFTRTDARHACGLTDTALRVHLDRLIALEIVLVHRGGYGSRFEYELAFEGEVGTDAVQFVGLLDVETLRAASSTLQGAAPSLQGTRPKLAPTLHPANTPVAPGLQADETPRSASAGAASSLVAACAPETARLGTPRTKPSHAAQGRASAAGAGSAGAARNGSAFALEH
ncbi:MAG: CHC2 zinc finger domain-containing protein [Dokdonella sp.]